MSAHFPAWFRPEALGSDGFWAPGVSTSLSDFLASYSLHDSQWLGLSVDPRYDGDGVAAFCLNTFWFRELGPAVRQAHWAALLVRFNRVRALRLSGFDDDEASPRTIAAAECQSAGADAVLVVEDIYGGRVEITHSPEVVLLCLTWDGDALPVPGLAAS